MSEEIFGYIGLKQEPGFGEESEADEIFGEVREDSISMNNNLMSLGTINSVRFDKFLLPGAVSASGGLSLDLAPEGISPWLMKGLFGSVASTEIATGVHEHVFSVLHASRLPSFNIRSGYGELAQNWRGCTVSGAALSFSKSEPVAFSASIAAQRPEEAQDTVTPSFEHPCPFNSPQASFYFNGSTDIRFESFSVSIDNDIEEKHSHHGYRWCRSHVARRFTVRGSFTLEFESEAERRLMWGSLISTGPEKLISPVHLSMFLTHNDEVATGHNYYFKLDIPEVYIKAAPGGIRRESDRILQTVSFMPVYSRTHDKYADIIIRNGVESYPDPE